MKRLKIRALIYPLIIIPILAVTVFAVTLCLRAGQVPSAIINSSIVASLANRVGVQFSLGSLHVGCFQADCDTLVDAGRLEVTLRDVGQLHISLDNIHWCAVHPLSIHGLNINAPTLPDLSVGNFEFTTATRAADVHDIRIRRANGSPVTIQRISTSPAVSTPQDNRLTLDRVEVAGVNAEFGGTSTTANICERTQTIFAASDEMSALAESGQVWLNGAIARTKRDLLYLTIILAAVLLVLKLLATGWMKWRVRLILSAGCVALPLVTYSLLQSNLGPRRVIGAALAASLVLALVSWALYYRKAIHWYQRWEPFTVDLACFAIVLPLIAYNFDFNPRVQAPASVAIGNVAMADSSFVVNTSRCGEAQVVKSRISALTVGDVTIQLPNPVEQMTVLKIASLQLPAIEMDVPGVQLSNLEAAVQDVSFALDGRARKVRDLHAGFNVSGTVRSGATEPIQFTAAGGSIALDPEVCGLNYGANLKVVRKPLSAAVVVAGDSKIVRFHGLRTLPGSVFHVADGSGTLSFTRDLLATLRLSGIGATVGSSRLQVASADVSAKAPPPCSTGGQSVAMAVNGAEIGGADGWTARVARSDIDFSRGVTGNSSGTLTLHGTQFANPSAQITASVPTVQFALAGVSTGALVPLSFRGELSFSVSTGRDVIFGNDAPLKFSTNFNEGDLMIPLQSQVFRQTAFPDLPNQIPLRLSANGRFRGNIDAFVHVPQLAIPLGPLHAELNGLELHRKGEALNFTTDWNRVSLPRTPTAFCLEEISQLTLSTTGEVTRFAFPGLASRDFAGGAACPDIPSLPSEDEFRFEGTLPGGNGQPAFRLERRSGAAVEIRSLQGHLRKLDLTDGQLRTLELESESSGIRILNRAAESAATVRISILENGVKLSSVVTQPNSEVLELAMAAAPGQLHVEAFQKQRPSRVTADAWFDGPELVRLNADLDLAPGPLTSTRDFDVSTGHSTIKVKLERDILNVDADVSRLALNGRDATGGVLRGSVDLRTQLRGKFFRDGAPPANPVMALVSKTTGNLAQDYRRAFPGTSPKATFKWDLRLANSENSEPLLRINDDLIGLRLAANLTDFSDGALNVHGQVGIDGDVRIHNEQLVVDAYTPIHLTTSGLGRPFSTINLNLPVLVVLSDALKPAQAPDRLWDTDYYASFWSGYQIDQASRGTVALVDESRLVVGPFSIREVVGPLQTLRIAIGHSGGLGFHVPLSARLLHGTARGFVDAAMTWPTGQMALDTRAVLTLRNLQAGALGLDSDGGQVPFLEHELDGDVSLSTTGWPLTIDASSFGVNIRTSDREALPGVFQVRSDVSVRTLNQVLDKIAKNLQLRVPPSSIFFRNLAFSFNVDKGKVRTDKPWLALHELRILSSKDLNLDGNIRLLGAKDGETVDLRDLLRSFEMSSPND